MADQAHEGCITSEGHITEAIKSPRNEPVFISQLTKIKLATGRCVPLFRSSLSVGAPTTKHSVYQGRSTGKHVITFSCSLRNGTEGNGIYESTNGMINSFELLKCPYPTSLRAYRLRNTLIHAPGLHLFRCIPEISSSDIVPTPATTGTTGLSSDRSQGVQ